MVNSTSDLQPGSPRSSPILTTGWICSVVILYLFQALIIIIIRWLARSERVRKMRKWRGWKKGKGRSFLSPVSSCLFFLFFIFYFLFFIFFMFALFQFSGPNYLETWNRLSHSEFQILGHACKENNGQLATFYLLGFFNLFIFICTGICFRLLYLGEGL